MVEARGDAEPSLQPLVARGDAEPSLQPLVARDLPLLVEDLDLPGADLHEHLAAHERDRHRVTVLTDRNQRL